MISGRKDKHFEHRASAATSGATTGLPGDAAMAMLDTFETNVLKIARHFFQAFAHPEGHAWLSAFRLAEQVFPVPFGASIAHAVVIAINEFATSRRRPFQFDKPTASFEDRSLTDCERYFILVLHHIRRRDWISARAQALYLCEGNDTSGILAAFERLAVITGDVTEPHFNQTRCTVV